MDLNLIYEDNHILVVVKPRGVMVQKDSTGANDFQSKLKEFLKRKYNKPGEAFLGIVHRLDQPVGGVMVFAKTSKAASRLSEQIRQHEWKKEYLAIVDGAPGQKIGVFEDYLVKDTESNRVFVSKRGDPRAKAAKLCYEVLKKARNGRSLLKIFLETGRSHQIRVQLASRNMPIVNDHKYSRNVKFGADIALWAFAVEIIHPVTKEKMRFEEPMPADMEELLF